MIDDEIQSLQTALKEYEGEIDNYLIVLRDRLGLDRLDIDDIERFDCYAEDYYGKNYLDTAVEELIDNALANDAEIRVLENALENSEQKKILAIKGKWDFTGSLFGRYDFRRYGNSGEPEGYQVGLGFNLRLRDRKLLNLSKEKAQAEIDKYQALINRQEIALSNLIERKCSGAKSLREQVDELKLSMILRRRVFKQKYEAMLKDKETLDNLVSARTNLLDTMTNLNFKLSFFFGQIIDLDSLCGVYFTSLDLSVNEH